MPLNKDLLLNFLSEQLGVETEDVLDDTPLFSSGLIDSNSLVELVLLVETEGGVCFQPDDVNLENLDSIQQILRFVEESTQA